MQVVKVDLDGVEEGYLLQNVLSEEECQQFIEITEKIGYCDAPITVGMNKAEMMKDIRDNMRVMCQADIDLLCPIWERIKAHFPKQLNNGGDRIWQLNEKCGLNERLRFYRYDKNQRFAPHYDGCFRRTTGEQSHFTIIIYLNEGFQGGETTFFPGGVNSIWTKRVTKAEIKVNPKMGTALIFRHTGKNSPVHEGSPHLSEGKRKYVLRSDIMYE